MSLFIFQEKRLNEQAEFRALELFLQTGISPAVQETAIAYVRRVEQAIPCFLSIKKELEKLPSRFPFIVKDLISSRIDSVQYLIPTCVISNMHVKSKSYSSLTNCFRKVRLGMVDPLSQYEGMAYLWKSQVYVPLCVDKYRKHVAEEEVAHCIRASGLTNMCTVFAGDEGLVSAIVGEEAGRTFYETLTSRKEIALFGGWYGILLGLAASFGILGSLLFMSPLPIAIYGTLLNNRRYTRKVHRATERLVSKVGNRIVPLLLTPSEVLRVNGLSEAKIEDFLGEKYSRNKECRHLLATLCTSI